MVLPYLQKWHEEGWFAYAFLPDLFIPRCGDCANLVFDYEVEKQLVERAVCAKLALSVPEESGKGAKEGETAPAPRLSVAEYHELIREGFLTEKDPVELWGGRLVAKMPKNRGHSLATRLTRAALERLVLEDWYVDSQEPVTLSDGEPEPDVLVVRGSPRDYLDRHPGPSDLGLVVEVSDRTLAFDSMEKKAGYAREQIPVYWIVNLRQGQLEVYTDPSGPQHEPVYRQGRIFSPSETIELVLGGKQVGNVRVRDLLP